MLAWTLLLRKAAVFILDVVIRILCCFGWQCYCLFFCLFLGQKSYISTYMSINVTCSGGFSCLHASFITSPNLNGKKLLQASLDPLFLLYLFFLSKEDLQGLQIALYHYFCYLNQQQQQGQNSRNLLFLRMLSLFHVCFICTFFFSLWQI